MISPYPYHNVLTKSVLLHPDRDLTHYCPDLPALMPPVPDHTSPDLTVKALPWPCLYKIGTCTNRRPAHMTGAVIRPYQTKPDCISILHWSIARTITVCLFYVGSIYQQALSFWVGIAHSQTSARSFLSIIHPWLRGSFHHSQKSPDRTIITRPSDMTNDSIRSDMTFRSFGE